MRLNQRGTSDIKQARGLRRDSEDEIGDALVVETRDLCFLREEESPAPFKRRHIVPPSNPDYSHSLTPTPALLFRYSALTFNAHAIHIDPEYTRNVYGFPNLLVHGPLALTLMLEYMGQIVLGLPGSGWAPVITEIRYRNLAPLFANEEMTICVKGKRRVEPDFSSPKTPVTESNVNITAEFSKSPSGGDDTVVAGQDCDPDVEPTSPQKAAATPARIDIGTGFSTLPPGKEVPMATVHDKHSEVKFEPRTSQSGKPETASNAGQYPHEWEIWIQTGRGDTATLAVRGTVKIEEYDENKQPSSRTLDTDQVSSEEQQQSRSKTTIRRVNKARLGGAGLTAQEIETFEKVKKVLAKRGGNGEYRQAQRASEKNNRTSSSSVAEDSPTEPSNSGEETSLPIRRTVTGPKKQAAKIIRYHQVAARTFSTTSNNTFVMPISHFEGTDLSDGEKHRLERSLRITGGRVKPRKSSSISIRPHNPKFVHNVPRGMNTFAVRDVQSTGNGIRQILVEAEGEIERVTSAVGAYERTLRTMLEGR